jgi:uncharacterized protein
LGIVHAVDSSLSFAATDLSNFLACSHLTLLDRATALGASKPPKFDDPIAEVVRQRGIEHEQACLDHFEADGLQVVRIDSSDDQAEPAKETPLPERWRQLAARTLEAMRSGADVIYQGCLFDDGWLGYPDFLQRVDTPSSLGRWSYEVTDAKLAREAKGGALLQLCAYSDLLERIQGIMPEKAHLALGGPAPRTESFRLADYLAYYRSVKGRFQQVIAEAGKTPPFAPDPVPHCEICAWKTRCDWERHEADHLALVAGISRRQRQVLREHGVTTMAGLAKLPLPVDPPVDGVGPVSVERICKQARIQVEGREAGEPRREFLRPIVENEGLASLPEPSPADLFLDMEGDPYALDDGLDYLIGLVDMAGIYTPWWALDRAEEKAAFEALMDFVIARREEHPDLHIYHFGHYEETHLKQLMGRYGTREDELDRLLRGGVLVDLYRVVRQSLRASVESYSIKQLEPFYGFTRDVDLREANHALAWFEAWLESGGKHGKGDEFLEKIEYYNRDDCLSTLRLRDWLEELREELATATGAPVPRPAQASPEPSEGVSEQNERVARLEAELVRGVSPDLTARSPEEHGRWLLAQLLQYHRREQKSLWWEFFRCLELSDEERIEDRSALGGLTYEGIVDRVKRSVVHRYRFPPQEHTIKVNNRPVDPATQKCPGTVVELDDISGLIDLKRAANSDAPHPKALILKDIVGDAVIRESLIHLTKATIPRGLVDDHPNRAAVDLLVRNRPRVGLAPGEGLRRPGEDIVDAACRLVCRLDRSVLPIQGPPGSGKTFTGARMVLALLKHGKRVGVTGPSHKVVGNLLDEICDAARMAGESIKGIQKCEEEDRCQSSEIQSVNDNRAVWQGLADGSAQLAAGTTWLWSRPEMAGSVHYLFIDEAGQFSLANALAVCQAADSLILLGDPRQLEQPQQGSHPPGTDVSALDHLLGDEATMPSDRGLFLDQTWRLHSSICAFTSEIFYEGRLESRPGLERQVVNGPDPMNGTGLRLFLVGHSGNQTDSRDEVEVIARLIDRTLEAGATWTDSKREERPLRWSDILIVAPYNAQVSALAARLPQARVGTVDKFQGQEAPIVIYSMTTSTPDDAPRGMSFLYSGNRLNVATSRARCIAVVVASPELLVPECRTPQQMKMANAFCRYQEIASDR